MEHDGPLPSEMGLTPSETNTEFDQAEFDEGFAAINEFLGGSGDEALAVDPFESSIDAAKGPEPAVDTSVLNQGPTAEQLAALPPPDPATLVEAAPPARAEEQDYSLTAGLIEAAVSKATPPEQRVAALEQLLDAAPNQEAKTWILKRVNGGIAERDASASDSESRSRGISEDRQRAPVRTKWRRTPRGSQRIARNDPNHPRERRRRARRARR